MTDFIPIAVTAMAGIFPGAPDVRRFWRNIVAGVDATAPVEPGRWPASPDIMVQSGPVPDHAYTDRCCLVRQPDLERRPAGVTLSDYDRLDPLHKLVLHTAAGLKESAPDFSGRHTGLVLAAIALPTEGAAKLADAVIGDAFEGLLFKRPATLDAARVRKRCAAARVTAYPGVLVSRLLGLGGQNLTLDAACASSLYAVKLACDALAEGRADAMVAGGVSRPDCLYTQVGFSQLQALSRSGRCAAFDARADGLVVGEGCGLMVLKRLDDALRQGDRIYGVIRGIGLSNDMQGSLLAPAAEGQLRAMQQAYRLAGWSPADVDLIECHGAGTPVGDAVEIQSYVQLWHDLPWQKGQCAIGSVKTMIGHLLTAAGAAGLIKTLLALEHETLPPSLHFRQPPANSPLPHSPFRVQTEPQPWLRRSGGAPRRAAVSAFGFGGINAHLLLEEGPGRPAGALSGPRIADSRHGSPRQATRLPAEPVAVVGMGIHIGPLDSLQAFEGSLFSGRPAFVSRPRDRWFGLEEAAGAMLDGSARRGAWVDRFELDLAGFGTPPREIPEILPQQLLATRVCAAAMRDAGLALRGRRPDMGCLIGISFDMQATDFHLRWRLHHRIRQWIRENGLDLSEDAQTRWLHMLQARLSPPLNATRTLGALGSVAASRVAKHLGLGGPSYVVSAEESSGLAALEIAVDALQRGELAAALVGAVDMAGDIRSVLLQTALLRLASGDRVRPFDARADGALPGEGAVALVLKRLSDARADGDRIYAVVLATASAAKLPSETVAQTYTRALERIFQAVDGGPERIGLVETHGSGDPAQDRPEAEALQRFLAPVAAPCSVALGAAKALVGHTGAASALVSLARACLCLHRGLLPPLPGYRSAADGTWTSEAFHVPRTAQFWPAAQGGLPRRALCAAITVDGHCRHVLLEAPPSSDQKAPVHGKKTSQAHAALESPPGVCRAALFVVDAADREALSRAVQRLRERARTWASDGLPPVQAALRWHSEFPPDPNHPVAAAVVAADLQQLQVRLEAPEALSGARPAPGLYVTPREPLPAGRIAFVYPGSGNQYLGMMRGLGASWPDVFRRLERESRDFSHQLRPNQAFPRRRDWTADWEKAAADALDDPLNVICTQIIFGMAMTDIVRRLGIEPQAAIGYSLGETAALFALGFWRGRDEMMARALSSDLFTRQLAGPCLAARRAWGISDQADFRWATVLVNCPSPQVEARLSAFPLVRRLIVNTDRQCVVGGERAQVRRLIDALNCDAIDLRGVTSVHCDAVEPVRDAYRRLHLLETHAVPAIDLYGCARAGVYTPSRESAADAILAQALHGFDFPRLIRRAHDDDVRLFVEMGPQNSCTRMIDAILADRPHLAVAASTAGREESECVLHLAAQLAAWRLPVRVEALYSNGEPASSTPTQAPGVTVTVGRRITVSDELRRPLEKPVHCAGPELPAPLRPAVYPPGDPEPPPAAGAPLVDNLVEASRATAEAHRRFLDLSRENLRAYTENRALEALLYQRLLQQTPSGGIPAASRPAPAFSREMCMEFAVGSVARVLGPAFSPVDGYRVRVRLPDEPLMLVDRILTVEGEKGSLTSGRVVTEHDVHPDAWYMDGGRAPVCISVEAGQADLFLCAYLGIDLVVRGQRAYRLLDAEVTFHRGLPRPGETIRYEIHIDRFVKQGDTWLFFFRFDGTIDGRPLITMRNGCAGFFTAEEIGASGGIVLTEEEKKPLPGRCPPGWQPPASFMENEGCDDAQLDALRRGDLGAAFGSAFAGRGIAPGLRLPGGRMKLIDRVLEMAPRGGRYGLGRIRAEADIHPDDWFLTCHFVDDRVMPGTLMYECCAHTLRVLLQRMGWISDKAEACYEPVCGIRSRLKCRGPVTPETRKVLYEVEIKELGWAPEPFAVADAHMYADGRYIVRFEDMSIKMTGVRRDNIEALWSASAPQLVCDRRQIEAYACGKPSQCFGEAYRIFDEDRFLARLPSPPFLFVDRVTSAEPPPLALAPGGWIEAQHDLSAANWYFAAERTGVMPYSVLLECALQPCGWLAAYLGSALRSRHKLQFRNLGGTATIYRDVPAGDGLLRMRVRLTNVSEAAAMIIEHFVFEVLLEDDPVYSGTTYFGFFTPEALSRQKGIADAPDRAWQPEKGACRRKTTLELPDEPPFAQDDSTTVEAGAAGARLPTRALRMLDRIDCFLPDGGPHGLGFIRGVKDVKPDEWFFRAHFYQDPVWPGSLGIEAFLLLIKAAALKRWPQRATTGRFSLVTGRQHQWVYRGQVTPQARRVTVEAVITHATENPLPVLLASGFLKVDGLYIYEMQDFGVALLPPSQPDR